MCGHVFMYQDRYALQRHRPVWQCSTCGRVSSVPLDCCPRPDFARHYSGGLTHLLGQWVSAFGHWARARVHTLWQWQRYPVTKADTMHATASVTVEVMIPAVDRDESPAGDDVVVAAGERR